MKALFATILITGTLSAAFLNQPREMTAEELNELPSNVGNFPPTAQAIKSTLNLDLLQGPYEKCFDLTEQALYNMVETIRTASNKDYQKAYDLFIQTYTLAIRAGQCFQPHEKVEASVSEGPIDCLVRHFNQASSLIHLALDDVQKGDWPAALDDVSQAIKTIQDITSCL